MNEELRTHYVYLITNLINNKTYVGKRICRKNQNPEKDNYMGSGVALGNAKKKYGIENFSKEILAICYSKNILNILEKEYIKLYREIGKAEYNISDGGEGGHGPMTPEMKEKIRISNLGKKRSEEVRKKMSEFHRNRPKEVQDKIANSLRGRKNGPRSETVKQHISEGIRNSEKWHNAMKSEERSKKLSEALKGRPSWNKGMKMSDEFCENVSTSINAMYNSPKGEIVKDKIRKARANQVITEETRKKISESQKQIIHTPEWNRKVSEAQKGKTVSEETKQKIREKRKLQAPMSEESKQKFKKSIAEYWNSPEGQLQKKINSERNKGKKNTKGLHWYNNGTENVVAEKCPDGYVPGRLGNFTCSEEEKQKKREYERNLTSEQRESRSKKISEAHKGHTTSQETRQNISKANKGRKYYNNGIIEVMRFEQPEGFVPGRLPSVFHKN